MSLQLQVAFCSGVQISNSKQQICCTSGRDWGAGWDFDIQPWTATPPPPQPPPPPANLAGTYDFTDQNCNHDAPLCTCLGGYIAVQHAPGANTASASLNMAGYPQHVIQLTEQIKGAWTVNYILSTCDNRADQILDITISPSQQSTTAILNVGVTFVLLCALGRGDARHCSVCESGSRAHSRRNSNRYPRE